MDTLWYYLGYDTTQSASEEKADDKTLRLRSKLLCQIRDNRLKLRPIPPQRQHAQRRIRYYKIRKKNNDIL